MSASATNLNDHFRKEFVSELPERFQAVEQLNVVTQSALPREALA